MDIVFEHVQSASVHQLLRKAGYSPIRDFKTKKESYVRTLGAQHYPRFHIYVLNTTQDSFKINLHLDMKQTSYEGQARHGGEYDSEQVHNEAARIQSIFHQKPAPKESDKSKKKSFWDIIFK